MVAKNNEDLIVKDFEDEDRDEDGDLEEFGKLFDVQLFTMNYKTAYLFKYMLTFSDNDVESARCTCGGNGEPGIRHGTEGFFGSLFG